MPSKQQHPLIVYQEVATAASISN